MLLMCTNRVDHVLQNGRIVVFNVGDLYKLTGLYSGAASIRHPDHKGAIKVPMSTLREIFDMAYTVKEVEQQGSETEIKKKKKDLHLSTFSKPMEEWALEICDGDMKMAMVLIQSLQQGKT